MAKFKFRLDILLKLALRKEDDVKKELASWQNLIQDSKEKLHKVVLNISEAYKEKSIQKNINEILLYETYLERLRKTKKVTEDEIEYFEQEKEKTIVKLQEAIKERKILEKLKEKKLENYIFEENQIEQKELDEIGTKIFRDGR